MANSCSDNYSTLSFSLSALSLSSLNFTSLLYPIDSPLKCPNPGLPLQLCREGKGKEDTPHWVQLGFKNVKLFSSTKFQPGQQREDSVLGAPARSPDQEVSPIAPIPRAHFALSLPFSGSTGGLAISLTPNTPVNSFCSRPWLRNQIWRVAHSRGVEGKHPKKADGIRADEVVNFDRHYKTINIDNWKCFSVGLYLSSGWPSETGCSRAPDVQTTGRTTGYHGGLVSEELLGKNKNKNSSLEKQVLSKQH